MICYHCGCNLTAHDFCTNCGADVGLYKKIMAVSNLYYNEGLEKAGVRDLSGAIVSLRERAGTADILRLHISRLSGLSLPSSIPDGCGKYACTCR